MSLWISFLLLLSSAVIHLGLGVDVTITIQLQGINRTSVVPCTNNVEMCPFIGFYKIDDPKKYKQCETDHHCYSEYHRWLFHLDEINHIGSITSKQLPSMWSNTSNTTAVLHIQDLSKMRGIFLIIEATSPTNSRRIGIWVQENITSCSNQTFTTNIFRGEIFCVENLPSSTQNVTDEISVKTTSSLSSQSKQSSILTLPSASSTDSGKNSKSTVHTTQRRIHTLRTTMSSKLSTLSSPYLLLLSSSLRLSSISSWLSSSTAFFSSSPSTLSSLSSSSPQTLSSQSSSSPLTSSQSSSSRITSQSSTSSLSSPSPSPSTLSSLSSSSSLTLSSQSSSSPLTSPISSQSSSSRLTSPSLLSTLSFLSPTTSSLPSSLSSQSSSSPSTSGSSSYISTSHRRTVLTSSTSLKQIPTTTLIMSSVPPKADNSYEEDRLLGIIGLSVGGSLCAFSLLLIVISIVICRRQKRKQRQNDNEYHSNSHAWQNEGQRVETDGELVRQLSPGYIPRPHISPGPTMSTNQMSQSTYDGVKNNYLYATPYKFKNDTYGTLY